MDASSRRDDVGRRGRHTSGLRLHKQIPRMSKKKELSSVKISRCVGVSFSVCVSFSAGFYRVLSLLSMFAHDSSIYTNNSKDSSWFGVPERQKEPRHAWNFLQQDTSAPFFLFHLKTSAPMLIILVILTWNLLSSAFAEPPAEFGLRKSLPDLLMLHFTESWIQLRSLLLQKQPAAFRNLALLEPIWGFFLKIH